jgi:hypothetical protein
LTSPIDVVLQRHLSAKARKWSPSMEPGTSDDCGSDNML